MEHVNIEDSFLEQDIRHVWCGTSKAQATNKGNS
jgi:hypothetical protein